jgi:hypothetical protein
MGGPLQFDLAGDLRGFDAARANPYVVRYLAWQAAQGSITARVEGRVSEDALDARVDVQLSRLEVVRAAPNEAPGVGAGEATGAGAGLPLNLIVALMRDSRGNINASVPVSGRLGDPRFDFRDAMRSAIRTVVTNTIAAPVSWIGRLHASPDSGIQSVEVDPIRFQPASTVLTADGRAQASRVAAFLGQFGEVRMALAPVVSPRDLAGLRRQAAEAAVDHLAGSQRLSREAAAARLFRERLPNRPVPAELGATLAGLADTEASPALSRTLAARRLETLRAALQQAGIQPTRLVDAPVVERPDEAEGAIELSLVEPDGPQRSPVRQLLSGRAGTAAGPSE